MSNHNSQLNLQMSVVTVIVIVIVIVMGYLYIESKCIYDVSCFFHLVLMSQNLVKSQQSTQSSDVISVIVIVILRVYIY